MIAGQFVWRESVFSGNWAKEVFHKEIPRGALPVNNFSVAMAFGLISLAGLNEPHLFQRGFSVNKLWTRIHCRIWDFRYDVRSSLKELRWTAVIVRKSQVVSKMIPGNWGKVESGWLARPLQKRIARFGGGGRIHQFLWSRSHAVSYAKRDLTARSD